MDPNRTRYHVVDGWPDWKACAEEKPAAAPSRLGWNAETETRTLRKLLTLFPRGQRDAPLSPAARRGAARDRFGNWFWIGHDHRTVYWMPQHSRRVSAFWTQAAPARPAPPAGQFHPAVEEPPVVADLGGLAVTTHHYLVAGDVTRRSLLLFDLHAAGAPLRLLFPDEIPFEPFDITPAPGGGVFVLDRRHRTYFALDRTFRLVTEPERLVEIAHAEEADFRPAGGTVVVRPSRKFPEGFPVAADDPISIEALPDGSVLILDATPSPRASRLLHYRLGVEVSPPLALADDVEVTTEGEESIQTHLDVIGHDIAWHDGTLYVVERDGNQVIAFALDVTHASPPLLAIKIAYLPMHFFGGRALVATAAADPDEGLAPGVFYDVVGGDPGHDAAVRWVPLEEIDVARYERQAVIVTPVLDGLDRDCVWHRLLLDACIPGEASVTVSTRASNDPDLLESLPFGPEPPPYLRGRGAEIPFFRPYAERQVAGDGALPEGTGTWELLFQRATGRYLQIRLGLAGNGRVTPELRTLRAWYPRFSYPRRYLPAIYLEDAQSADFLERFLANPEGILTELEARMDRVTVLFDARSAPPDTLDWLASWLGLVLDPLWAQIQTRRLAAAPGRRPPDDRRRLFIRYARRLYDRRGTPGGVKFALQLFLDPCLERTLRGLKLAAVRPNPRLTEQLARLGVPAPAPAMSEQDIEDLLYEILLSPERRSKIRIVERFLTRGGRARQAGDPTAAGAAESLAGGIAAYAHRFSVLVPERLDPAEAAMVERIVSLEKPAHAQFDVRAYWDFFRVGEARLGIDTALGDEPRFLPTILGRNRLADGYLHPSYPMDVTERVVADRDRVGDMPAL